jgi:hypothetical protein
LQAARRFSELIAGRGGAQGKASDPKAALVLWTETANQVLLETQRSEPFLQTQAAMIRATTELRLAPQELVEHFGKQYGFPTRTELDDVHRTVTELRRELRAMRREQRRCPTATCPGEADPDDATITRDGRQEQSDTRMTQTGTTPATAFFDDANAATLLHGLRDADVRTGETRLAPTVT